MKIVLNNGTEMNPIAITGGPAFIQRATRDTLSFIFPASEGMDALDAAFTAEACESITIVDGENEFVHKGYTVRASLKKESVEVSPATAESAAVFEDRITVCMAQRTYEESQIQAMMAMMAEMQAK